MPHTPTPQHLHSPTPLHPLTDALALHLPNELISLTGGGGKTSLLFALSRELATAGHNVIATTTTRIATTEVLRAPSYCLANDLSHLHQNLAQHHFCVVVGSLGHDKAKDVPIDLPAKLLAHPDVAAVIVEADGAKMLPVKAPADHEPVVPPQTTLLIPLAGIDALSAPIQDIAHRPSRLAGLLGISLHEKLTPEHVARLLTSPHGGLRNAPPQARVIPFINKVETDEQHAQALQIARQVIGHPRINRVLVGALQTDHPVRQVIEK